MLSISFDSGTGGLMPSFTIALLVAGTATLFILYARQKGVRGRTDQPAARRQVHLARATVAVEEEMSARMAEMLDLAQRLAAQLDTKAAQLKVLLDRAEAMRRELDPAPKTGHRDIGARLLEPALTAIDPSGATSTLVQGNNAFISRDEVIRLAEEGRSPVEIAQRLEETIGSVELILALHRQAQRPIQSVGGARA
jgi:hypothetical protein